MDVARGGDGIIADVRARGDAACRADRRFDRLRVTPRRCASTPAEIAAADAQCPEAAARSPGGAAQRIEAFHRRQLPEDADCTDAAGVALGWRWTPLDAVGLYVPGGTAAYPSSVLMNAVPARVAGVGAHGDGRADAATARSTRWCWPRPSSPASTRSTASAARRRWRRWPTARRPSPRSTRSSGPATPMSPRPSARCSAGSAST